MRTQGFQSAQKFFNVHWFYIAICMLKLTATQFLTSPTSELWETQLYTNWIIVFSESSNNQIHQHGLCKINLILHPKLNNLCCHIASHKIWVIMKISLEFAVEMYILFLFCIPLLNSTFTTKTAVHTCISTIMKRPSFLHFDAFPHLCSIVSVINNFLIQKNIWLWWHLICPFDMAFLKNF